MPRRQLPPVPPPESTTLQRSKLSQEFEEHIELYGDPRIKLIALGEAAEADGDLSTAVRAFSEVAQYVAPKLRSMEVQAEVQSTHVIFNIDLGDEDEENVIDAPSVK